MAEKISIKKSFIVTIDGPGGVGKSTIAKRIASFFDGIYVDTGAMYRAFAIALNREQVELWDSVGLEDFCKKAEVLYRPDSGCIYINGTDYSAEIRSEEAGALASKAAVKSVVRKTLVAYQRTFRNDGRLVVMEGRDIGTVVFPHADIKFFLDADAGVRAGRRLKDSSEGGGKREIKKILEARDRRDSEREDSPLERAEDAIYIDSTHCGVEEVAGLFSGHIKKRLPHA